MSLLDPAERSARGARLQGELTGAAPGEPATLLQSATRDFVYAEVWSRPGLDLRSRFLIALAGAAGVGDRGATQRYAHGALATRELTLAELREAALHSALYGGWSTGMLIDEAVTAAADALGLPPVELVPVRTEPWDPQVRLETGAANFRKHMLFGGPRPTDTAAYLNGGILNFVFGEMWDRPGLDQRARRWLTLVGVGNSASSTPIRSHIWTAMASGNATRAEMYEFVLQYAVHAGWPRGSVMQTAVQEQADRVEQGLPFIP